MPVINTNNAGNEELQVANNLNDEEEAESWNMTLQAMEQFVDMRYKPADKSTRIPKRLVGSLAILFLDGEWELAKIEQVATNDVYRYKLMASWEYCTFSFSEESHGRFSEAVIRWVLCVAY